MSKLTLSVAPSVVARAKHYAKQQGVSVSKLVEAYLECAVAPPSATELPPVLRSVRGILKKADVEEYWKHLSRK